MEETLKKKILFVTTISGLLPHFEDSDVAIAKELGYSVFYASNFDNPVYDIPQGYFIKNDITCYQIGVTKSPYHLVNTIKVVNKLVKVIDEEKIDIVHCHNPMGGVVARLAAKLSKSNPVVIYTAHGLHFYKGAPKMNWLLFYPVEKYLAHYTDLIVSINQEDYLFMKKHFVLKKDGKIELIHGVGIDTNRFSPRNELFISKRKELSIPENAFHIVTAAELNKNKNQKAIIKAISQINDSNIYYSLCGKGKKEKELSQLIKKKGLEDRVILRGFRTDMEEVIQTADVFAFPSIREGLGVAAIEALSCGVPLIASDNRGTREYARNNINGIVCNSNDIEAFRRAIEKLSKDKGAVEELKNNCRGSVKRFSKERTAIVMRAVYEWADKKVKERKQNA